MKLLYIKAFATYHVATDRGTVLLSWEDLTASSSGRI